MEARSIGSNMSEVLNGKGARVLVSYSTPVAAFVHGEVWVCSEWYSTTTTTHINKFTGLSTTKNDKDGARVVSTAELRELIR